MFSHSHPGHACIISRRVVHPFGEADDEKAYRREVYADYGRLVSSLQGVYVTAEDVGTSVEDMASVFSTTRHTTCIPPELGGSGNPSVPTARGIVCAIEAGLEHLGMGTLAGKSVAVQGLGHVGLPLAKFLAERGVARIVATDIFAANIDAARAELEGAVKDLDLRCVERGDNSVLAAEVSSLPHSLCTFTKACLLAHATQKSHLFTQHVHTRTAHSVRMGSCSRTQYTCEIHSHSHAFTYNHYRSLAMLTSSCIMRL